MCLAKSLRNVSVIMNYHWHLRMKSSGIDLNSIPIFKDPARRSLIDSTTLILFDSPQTRSNHCRLLKITKTMEIFRVSQQTIHTDWTLDSLDFSFSTVIRKSSKDRFSFSPISNDPSTRSFIWLKICFAKSEYPNRSKQCT